MAKNNSNNKIAMLTNFVLIVAALLIVAMVESREIGFIKGINKKSGPQCTNVYGVASGDTCFAVQQAFNLTTAFFDSINPNLVCDSLFVGQWLCVAGKA
ncbi:Peptidoglycan-binding Lysin subgroup [Corchorus olitorius]|uniref:Peptidoglycan-binding Lysin subgroup n=1 Tax=Corchorus olitorius TaxID=93759 RepID=A0A1R3H3X2_9ROSI|nr:Peptidoglycan-binding Lysin subgroup [Corchorus olitorius]